jgi:hypothetical protein
MHAQALLIAACANVGLYGLSFIKKVARMQDNHGFLDADLKILRRLVTDAVQQHLDNRRGYDPNLIGRLRRYERMAWEIGLDAHTIQVINSGRRLLGDREHLQPDGVQPTYRVGPEPPSLASVAA